MLVLLVGHLLIGWIPSYYLVGYFTAWLDTACWLDRSRRDTYTSRYGLILTTTYDGILLTIAIIGWILTSYWILMAITYHNMVNVNVVRHLPQIARIQQHLQPCTIVVTLLPPPWTMLILTLTITLTPIAMPRHHSKSQRWYAPQRHLPAPPLGEMNTYHHHAWSVYHHHAWSVAIWPLSERVPINNPKMTSAILGLWVSAGKHVNTAATNQSREARGGDSTSLPNGFTKTSFQPSKLVDCCMYAQVRKEKVRRQIQMERCPPRGKRR